MVEFRNLIVLVFTSWFIQGSPAWALDPNAECGMGVSCGGEVRLSPEERSEWSALSADGAALSSWSLQQMGRAADSYREARLASEGISDAGLRSRVQSCLTEARVLSASGQQCLVQLDRDTAQNPGLQRAIRSLYHSLHISLFAANYCFYHKHESQSLAQNCRDSVLSTAGARSELLVYLGAAEREAGEDSAANAASSPQGARGAGRGQASSQSPARPPLSNGRRSSASRTVGTSRAGQTGQTDLLQDEGSCFSENPSCSLSELRGEAGQVQLLSSGVPGRCLRKYSCEIARFQGGSSNILNTSLSEALMSHEAASEGLLEARRSELRLKLIEKVLVQWAALSATQAGSGCDYGRFQAEARRAIGRCGTAGGNSQFTAGLNQVLGSSVNSSAARQQFESICRRSRSAAGEGQVQAQAHSLRDARCRELFFREAPFRTRSDLRSAQSLWESTEGASAQSSEERAGRSVSPQARSDSYRTEFESQCGAGSFERTQSAVNALLAQHGLNQASVVLSDAVACTTQNSAAGLDDLSLSELGTREAIDRRRVDPLAASDARRVSIRQSHGEVDAFRAVQSTLAGACASDPNADGAFNLDTLETFVGSDVSRDSLGALSQSVHRPDGTQWEGYREILSCIRETRENTGTSGLMRDLSTACDVVMAATFVPGVDALSLPLNALCVVPQLGVASAASTRHEELLNLRRSLGGQLGCDTAPEIFRRLSTEEGHVNDALVASALQAGMTGVDLLAVTRGAHTVAESEEAIERAISSCRTGSCPRGDVPDSLGLAQTVPAPSAGSRANIGFDPTLPAPTRGTGTVEAAALESTLPAPTRGTGTVEAAARDSTLQAGPRGGPNQNLNRTLTPAEARTALRQPDLFPATMSGRPPSFNLGHELPVAAPRPIVLPIEACCRPTTFPANRSPTHQASNLATDAYYSGLGQHSAVPPGRAFEMTAPRELQVQFPNVREVRFPPGTPDERLVEELQSRGMNPNLRATLAGEGSMSRAFFVHPEITAELNQRWLAAAGGQYNDTYWRARNSWAQANASEVMKVRKSDVFQQVGNSAEAARQLRRDLAMQDFADQFARRTRFEGDPLVEVVRWTSGESEVSRGIVRQPTSRGPSVFELHEATSVVRRYSGSGRVPNPAEIAQLEHARGVLTNAGLSVGEAEQRIGALEEFYRQAHDPALQFQAENGLSTVGVRTRTGAVENSGLDYNHGVNAHWNPERRIFQIIDW